MPILSRDQGGHQQVLSSHSPSALLQVTGISQKESVYTSGTPDLLGAAQGMTLEHLVWWPVELVFMISSRGGEQTKKQFLTGYHAKPQCKGSRPKHPLPSIHLKQVYLHTLKAAARG